MNDLWVRAFHRLPAPARSLAATLRGRYLASWRYGPETDGLMAEALGRERWPESQWQAYQDDRLARILWRASRQVPYYRDQWAARRQRGDRRSPEYLEHWPILEKEPLRASPTAFVAEDRDRQSMFREHTSGTSGTSIDLWWSRDTVRAWYALFEARCRHWYGVSRHTPWGMLGGQLVKPVAERHPPFWVWNRGLKQLYLSAYHLAPDLIPSYLDALRTFAPGYLFGYSSSLHSLAQGVIAAGRTDLRFRVVITNAEPLLEHQRAAISAAFQCPVRETYGMAELVAAASECEAGRLHLWPEVGLVEVVDDDGHLVERGESGDFICTGLLNLDMPLIRYRIGDRGSLGRPLDCGCGRTLPLLGSIEGRADDILLTTDGRMVGRLDPVFKGHLPLREAQIIQERLDRVRVRFVPAPGFTPSTLDALVERLRARLGAVEVQLESVDAIPRTARGKFRAVICELSSSERERVRRLHTPAAIA